MCGRFSLTVDKETIENRFLIGNMAEIEYEPSYNIAPSQSVLAVINDNKIYKAGFLKWGLVPSWASDPAIGFKMINARAETLKQKPSFKQLLKRRRCIILADGFFEWKGVDKEKKPYRFLLKTGEPFAFAGLWDKWQHGEEFLTTCTIITTMPNSMVKNVHDRMPVILKKQDEAQWLNREILELDQLEQLLSPYNENEMQYYPVSTVVNSPKNNDLECIAVLE